MNKKIAILGDLHFGKIHSDQSLDHRIGKFLTEQFFPYLKKNNINTIIQLGDLTESKKTLNKLSMYNLDKYYTKPILENNYKLIQIVGNHDIFYNNRNDINSQDLIFNNLSKEDSKNIKIVSCIYNDPNLGISAVGWNYEFNEKNTQPILFGHFDIIGFEMQKGFEAIKGHDPKVFKNYDAVYSGHYHRFSKKGNITYPGTPVDLSFGESDIDHGFIIRDLGTGEDEFIKNPDKVFNTIIYDDSKDMEKEIANIKIKDNFIKVIKLKSEDSVKYEQFIEKINKEAPVLFNTSASTFA